MANAGDPDWWFTWLSSRDRFRPRAWNGMVALARRAAHPDEASNRGARSALIVVSYIADWIEDQVRLAKHVGLAVKRLRAARRHPSSVPASPVKVILVTILSERAVAREGAYEDVYFGRLHTWLAECGQSVLICGFPEGDAEAILAKAVQRSDVTIQSYGHLLNGLDIAKAYMRALTVHFRMPPLPPLWGQEAAPLLRADFRHERISVFEGLLIRTAMQRLLDRHREARLIHIYENNGWERANYQAAKSAMPPRPVTGYLHCAVLRSHLKNIYPPEEHGLRPMPDRIVTTGTASRDLLLTFGVYPPELVVAGCGLRAPLLSQISGIPAPRRPVRTILALFEGLVSVVPALQMFAQAASQHRQTRFLVRCHPQLPMERLAALAGVAYGPSETVDVSTPPRLEDAIAEADVVVYVSSTAALSALYAGRPLIKLDIDETVDDDPLTAICALKYRASRPEEVLAALDAIGAMDEVSVASATAEARRYLEDYLVAPSASSVAPFLDAPRVVATGQPALGFP